MKKTKLVTMLGAISLIGAIGAGSTFAYLTSTTGAVSIHIQTAVFISCHFGFG